MTQGKSQGKPEGKSDKRQRRAERLAAALKENLGRRKAQARGRVADEPAPNDRTASGEAPDGGDKP